MVIGRRQFIAALGGAAVAFAAHAEDQYPTRTVRIIVPSTPGGITDLLARVIGQVLTQSWGQPVIIENRPGADELIGTETVVKAPADGYMLLVASNSASLESWRGPTSSDTANRQIPPATAVSSISSKI